jgi:hypothetical protein
LFNVQIITWLSCDNAQNFKKTNSQKSLVYNLWETIKKMVQIVLVWITSLWWNVEHWLIANNYKWLCHLLFLVELSAYPLSSNCRGRTQKVQQYLNRWQRQRVSSKCHLVQRLIWMSLQFKVTMLLLSRKTIGYWCISAWFVLKCYYWIR